MSIISQTKEKMKAAIDHLKEEHKSIRTGRANPGILDGVMVEVYGTQMRLRDIANITTPEPRLLLIVPYDPQNASTIGKAIEKANLGIMPIVDANSIRLNIPPMDENRRKETVKLCDQKKEDAKISIRNIRREANETVRKQKSKSEINEDEEKRLEKEIQKLTDDFCKEVDTLTAEKEKEILTI